MRIQQQAFDAVCIITAGVFEHKCAFSNTFVLYVATVTGIVKKFIDTAGYQTLLSTTHTHARTHNPMENKVYT